MLLDSETWPVYVLDSSAWISVKQLIAIDEQFSFGIEIKENIEAGYVCYPSAVTREMREVKYPDLPGALVAGVSGILIHANPSDSLIAEVMQRVPRLIEAEAESDSADPYVVGQAIALDRAGYRPTVVTNDYVSRLPLKESLAEACRLFAIPWTCMSCFLSGYPFHRSYVENAACPAIEHGCVGLAA